MPVTTTTPLMNLVLPVVGPTGQVGPTWGTNNNDAFTLIDSHDHTSGKGTKVPTAGLTINADLTFNGYNAVSLNSVKLNSLGSALASSFTNCISVVGGELYFNDGSGTDVQLTSGGAINVSSLGTITGDYGTSSADLNYNDTTKTFSFKQDATKTAFITCGSVSIFENVAGAKFTKLQNTTSQGSDQTVTLWASLPGSTLPVKLSATGVLSTATIDTADITNLAVTSGKIAAATIAQSNMANDSVGTAQIINDNVTTAKILNSNVTTAKIADANVTKVKLAALGQQISASSGAFTVVGTSFTSVTNLSVTITTTGGRPVFVGCMGDTGNSSYFGITTNGGGTNAFGEIRIQRNGLTIYSSELRAETTSSTNNRLHVPAGSVWHIDAVSSGTYTYVVQIRLGVGTATAMAANFMTLVAYEI